MSPKNISKMPPKSGRAVQKICTVLPNQAESGSQNISQKQPVLAARTDPKNAQFWQPEQGSSGSQNCPVLGARTAPKGAVLARTVLSKLAAQFRQNPAVLAENPTSRTPRGCAWISAQSTEKNSDRPGMPEKVLPRLYKEQSKLYLHSEANQSSSYGSEPFWGSNE